MSVRGLAVALLVAAAPAAAQHDLRIPAPEGAHAAVVTELGDGSFEVKATDEDPYVLFGRVPLPFDHERLRVFAFEYRAEEGLDFFEVFFHSKSRGWAAWRGPVVDPSHQWRALAVDLSRATRDGWVDEVDWFRIDIGSGAGKTVRIRNVILRAPTEAEEEESRRKMEEQQRQLEARQAAVNATAVAPRRIAVGDPIGVHHRFDDGPSLTAIAVVGRDLDLPTLLAGHRDVAAPVPLPPPVVAGEGESPENHTLVRILDRHGICEVQFLAYPPEVRGGVRVEAGRTASDDAFIAVCPLSDASVREVRLFGRYGQALGAFEAPAEVPAPFAIAVGDFDPNQPGDEIALSRRFSRGNERAVHVLSLTGEPLYRVSLTLTAGELSLVRFPAQGGDRLIAHVAGQPEFTVVDPRNGEIETIDGGLPTEACGVFTSSDPARPYAAALREADASRVWRFGSEGPGEAIDAATREKVFWFTVDGAFAGIPEGRHSRHSALAHLRTDFMGTVQLDPDFSRTDEAYWADKTLLERIRARVATYDTDVPQCWEPCFTHRWFTGQARKWAEQVDEETGLTRYVLLDRDNQTGMYGEFGQTDAFTSGSYAPGLAAVQALYTYPLRAFVRELVHAYRANPEHFVAIEPNHEMEINPDSQETHGDYNPEMIRNFYSYLATLYDGLPGINATFGTPFTEEWFDAPRDLSRGPWDSYSVENPYYMAWMRFMNMVIYRVVAGTYREALLAGFPPEAVKCHQIPDHYAIASLAAFSKPAQRVTPIDWNLTAGVGFGFTRYGVWYTDEHNAVQGPNSSGFDHMVVGEYQSLHPDAQVAYEQLAYMRDHGVSFVHNMNWPEGHDRGYNAALRAALERVVAEDRPRAGVVGGIGQVRTAAIGGRAVDVVSIGTTPAHPGLIKSIQPDGSWEGSVYVQPFHARVDVTELHRAAEMTLTQPLSLGPFPGIDAGNAIELSFNARAADGETGTAVLRVMHAGHELEGCTLGVPVNGQWQASRLIVRVQLDCDSLTVELSSADGAHPVELRNLLATWQRERTLRLKKGEFVGQRHQGGVTFDVLR